MPSAASLVALGATALLLRSQDPHFNERVDVERVLLDARVLDGHGEPRRDLKPADFRLKVDGHVVPVESAFWVDAATPYAEGLSPEAASVVGAQPVPSGRLIVFFFQKDMERSRTPGLMIMLKEASRMLDTLQPGDRVAVASFDSHLKLWSDFTEDRESLRRSIRHSVLFESRPAEIREGAFPSLAAAFDPTAARNAATIETALRLSRKPLRALPGAKSLLFFGGVMGRMSGSLGVHLEADYGPAAEALLASRTTVFSLDVTNADYHSLEAGLKQIAYDTGGFYARTHDFPTSAMNRLRRALMGHYVLVFERPPLPHGAHSVQLGLVGVSGEVLARPGVDQARHGAPTGAQAESNERTGGQTDRRSAYRHGQRVGSRAGRVVIARGQSHRGSQTTSRLLARQMARRAPLARSPRGSAPRYRPTASSLWLPVRSNRAGERTLSGIQSLEPARGFEPCAGGWRRGCHGVSAGKRPSQRLLAGHPRLTAGPARPCDRQQQQHQRDYSRGREDLGRRRPPATGSRRPERTPWPSSPAMRMASRRAPSIDRGRTRVTA
jgi:VWFA-related protein